MWSFLAGDRVRQSGAHGRPGEDTGYETGYETDALRNGIIPIISYQ